MSLHELTITDHSGDSRDKERLLFRNKEGARGYAAKTESAHSYREYRLDGFPIYPSEAEKANAEQPCGDVIETRRGRVTRTWKAA